MMKMTLQMRDNYNEIILSQSEDHDDENDFATEC